MTYDGFVLAAVAAELKMTILHARVQKIRQHNATDLTLEIRAPGHTYLLFLSVDARFPRVYLTASSLPVPQEPPNFRMLLRKYVEGAFVKSIDQVGMDRVLKIGLDSSEYGAMTLILEIMGKHSNLILVDGEGRILGAAKNIGASVSRYRQVLPGRDYIPPPGAEKADPREMSDKLFDSMWSDALPESAQDKDAKKWLMDSFSGFGPFLADEVIARTTSDGMVSREVVKKEITQIGEMVRAASYMPVYVTNERGEGTTVYPMPSVQFPPTQQHPRDSINEALDALFRTLVTRTVLEDERASLLTAIRRAEAARKQTIKSIDRTLAESEKAERYKQIGELLLSNLHTIEKGAKSAIIQDYFDPDVPEIEVELDEKLTPQQNSDRYFKRYQKARDSVATSEARRAIIDKEIGVLEAAKRDAESTKSIEELKDLRRMLLGRDLLRSETVQEKPTEEFAGYRIRRYMTPDGWEILYGENSQSNDHLTQRVARPNDIWMHARAITGAHVVIRTAGHSGAVPQTVLAQAAKIAAQNSDAKHSSLVPIDRTLRKYVNKPRGSAPGFVRYRNEKTIDINPKA